MAFGATVDELLETAIARCGHDNFGQDGWREGLDRLVGDLATAGLSNEGEYAAREHLLSNLVARLRAVHGFSQNAEAMKRPIKRPLVVTGIVRSGTTALHKLLAIDPQFQGSEHWICASPQPRPPRAEWTENPDFVAARDALDAMIAISPEVLDDHGMAVDSVEESLNILAHGFHCNMYPSQYAVPGYDAWYRSTSDTGSYRYLADVMRLIGANDPDRTWLLKNPTDTFSMAEVFEVFPDAMVIQTHRDPVEAVPSVVNLIGGAHRMFKGEGREDYPAVFRREAEFWALALERADTVKQAMPGRIFDVQFSDFLQDQIGVVRRFYDHFGLILSEETEAGMRDWLVRNPRRKGAIQRHRAKDFGGSSPALAEVFADYRQRYGYSA
jgi:Sulfotransferase family